MTYPNSDNIAAGLRANCIAEDGTIKQALTPVERELHFTYVGGQIPKDDKDYMAICMNAARDKNITIWIDSDHVLVGETKRLIDDLFSPERRPDLSNDQRINNIRTFRRDLYNQIKDKPLAEREDIWINWLVEKCNSDRNRLKQRAIEIRVDLQKAPDEFAAQLGIAADKIRVRERRELFAPPDDADQEEKDLLASLDRHYDLQLVARLIPAGCTDLIRGLALHDIGGLYVDTDVLPLINPDLLQAVSSDPAFDAATMSAEMPIQQHLFAKHRDWFYPNGIAELDTTDSPATDWIERHFLNHRIDNLNSLFQPIGDIDVAQDLYLIKRITGGGLGTSVVAAHKRSPALRLVSIQQAKNLDYVETFNAAFEASILQEKYIAEERAATTPETIINARTEFLETYLAKNALPLPTVNFGDESKLLTFDYHKAIAQYPYDGFVPDCQATIQLIGPSVSVVSMFHILGETIPTKELITTIGLTGKFCEKTLLDAKSTWLVRSPIQNSSVRKPITFSTPVEAKSKSFIPDWLRKVSARAEQWVRLKFDGNRQRLAGELGIREFALDLQKPERNFTGTVLHMDANHMYLRPVATAGFSPNTVFRINRLKYAGIKGDEIGKELHVLIDRKEVRQTDWQMEKETGIKVKSLLTASNTNAAIKDLVNKTESETAQIYNLDPAVAKLVYERFGVETYRPEKAGEPGPAKDKFYGRFFCTIGDKHYFKLEGGKKIPILVEMTPQQVGKGTFVENQKYLIEIMPGQAATFTRQDRNSPPPSRTSSLGSSKRRSE